MTGREGQAPPPEHEDKPETGNGPASVGERVTGVSDPKDPDGLLTVDGEFGDPDPDYTAGAAT